MFNLRVISLQFRKDKISFFLVEHLLENWSRVFDCTTSLNFISESSLEIRMGIFEHTSSKRASLSVATCNRDNETIYLWLFRLIFIILIIMYLRVRISNGKKLLLVLLASRRCDQLLTS